MPSKEIKQESTREPIDKYDKPFPTHLRAEMGKNHITQKELAEVIGKTRQVVSLYCSGESMPDTDTLTSIARYLDVSSDYLLGLTDQKHSDLGLSIWAIEALKILNKSEDRGKALEPDHIYKNRLTIECINRVLGRAFLNGRRAETIDLPMISIFAYIEQYITSDSLTVKDGEKWSSEITFKAGADGLPIQMDAKALYQSYLADLVLEEMKTMAKECAFDSIRFGHAKWVYEQCALPDEIIKEMENDGK